MPVQSSMSDHHRTRPDEDRPLSADDLSKVVESILQSEQDYRTVWNEVSAAKTARRRAADEVSNTSDATATAANTAPPQSHSTHDSATARKVEQEAPTVYNIHPLGDQPTDERLEFVEARLSDPARKSFRLIQLLTLQSRVLDSTADGEPTVPDARHPTVYRKLGVALQSLFEMEAERIWTEAGRPPETGATSIGPNETDTRQRHHAVRGSRPASPMPSGASHQ